MKIFEKISQKCFKLKWIELNCDIWLKKILKEWLEDWKNCLVLKKKNMML